MHNISILLIVGFFMIACEARQGCVEGNCVDGAGRYVYRDYIVYEGDFLNGKRHGEGKIYSSKGTYYSVNGKIINLTGMAKNIGEKIALEEKAIVILDAGKMAK